MTKPSSSKKSEKKPGGQPGHQGTTLRQVLNPDHRVVHRVTRCDGCRRSLEQVAPLRVDIRQVFDIPMVQMEITQHEREIKCCPHCHRVQQAEFPSHVTNHVQYGPTLASLSLYWSHVQFIPYERMAEMIETWFGHSMSVGTLVHMVQRGYESIRSSIPSIEEALLDSPILHVDETSMRINGKNFWVHVASTETHTRLAPHRSRGKIATDEIGLPPRYKGTMMYDAYSVYPKYQQATHALCHAHHLRELREFAELHRHAWAKKMIDTLLGMKKAVEQSNGLLSESEAKRWEQIYEQVLVNAQQELDARSSSSSVKKAQAFVRRLQNRKGEALRFLREAHVPFDNNQAERDLRMVKVKQKISGSFRQESDAEAFCVTRSIVSTIEKHRKPVWDSLYRLLMGESLATILS